MVLPAPAPTATLPRSFLYVPADKPALFAKAASGPSDAVVLDLEDAVPLAGKDAARQHLADWLGELDPTATDRPEQWVRVSPEAVEDDLAAVVRPALDGIFLAKCDLASLDRASALLERHEARLRPGRAPTPVVGLVETAAGVLELARAARHPRLTTFGIGEADLLGELRMTRTDATAAAVDHLRTQVVVACAAAGAAAPVAPTSTDFRDLDGFAVTTRRLRDLGFRSRTAVHPGQVPVIHAELTPGPEEVAAAQDVLARFAAARGGATTDARGRLVDAAVVREAQETVDRHASVAARRVR